MKTNSLAFCVASLVALLAGLSGCGGGDGDEGGAGGTGGGIIMIPPLTNLVNLQPGASNTVVALFSRPFMGEYRILNYFDHDRPIHPDDTNGYQVTWRGARVVPGQDISGYDGHLGIDWLLPENTPVFAVTGGEVVFAGVETLPCTLQDNEIVNQLTARFKFVAPNGDTYTAGYVHLNRVDVAVGNTVTEGQQLGLSGVTGCVGKAHTPHLHLVLRRYLTLDPPVSYVVDPYGWEGPGVDPWSAQGPGRVSVWFWKPGQAPDMVPMSPR